MANERRRAQRLKANLFADLETADGTRLGRAVVTDVSVSGVAVESEAELPINSEIVCYVEVPIMFKAKVVRFIPNTTVRTFGLRIVGQSFWDRLVFRRVLKGPRSTRKVT
ncbi:MAG: PilZ domain-containing protein [Elusimicrobia bacterium]|nr:PilZ domain-containing protein [Elusimicrobiota bacterium]